MVTLLARMLIKNRDQTENAKVRLGYGMLCSALGIGLNILLFCGKYLAGVLSGSIAITADAFNNLSDASSSAVTLLGFRLSGRRADAGHPFGHGRIEYLAGLGVALAIILTGLGLLRTSIGKIRNPEPIETGLLITVILVISICVKLYMCFYNRSIGKKICSETMRATAADSLSDSLATTAVLFSMAISHYAGKNVDGWCGLLVACFVLYTGYSAAKDTMNPLLGEPPSKEFVEEIRETVLQHPQVLGIHDIVVHDYGPGRRMVSLHGEVDGNQSVFEIHEVIDHIEKELNEKLGCESVIHMDPVEPDNLQAKEIQNQIAEKINKRFPGVSIHDFRMIQCQNQTKLIFEAQVPYEFDRTNEEVKRGIEELVSENWENHLAVIQVEQSYV